MSLDAFNFAASPPSWYEVAKSLHEQAVRLREDDGTLVHFVDRRGHVTTRRNSNRAVFLLAGFATENMIKAFLIYEHPQYVSSGALSRTLRSHQLANLWNSSACVPYKARYAKTVASLQDGLESWARYPCGLTSQQPFFEQEMTAQLWGSYGSMFSACGRRLERLLTAGWLDADGDRCFMRYETDPSAYA
jgi:hypothetical protein